MYSLYVCIKSGDVLGELQEQYDYYSSLANREWEMGNTLLFCYYSSIASSFEEAILILKKYFFENE